MAKRLFPLVLSILLVAGPAWAEKGGNGKDRDNGPAAARDYQGKPGKGDRGGKGGKGADRAEDAAVAALISVAERTLIQDYFGRGMVRAEPLPPGIAKNLARGKPLPPGIAKKMPDDLQTRLRPPHGHAYQVVGSDVVLVNLATNVVVELLHGVLR